MDNKLAVMVNCSHVACITTSSRLSVFQLPKPFFRAYIAREATEENSGEAFDEPGIDDREGFVTVN